MDISFISGFLAIMNNVALNTVYKLISLGFIPRHGISGSYDNSLLIT